MNNFFKFFFVATSIVVSSCSDGLNLSGATGEEKICNNKDEELLIAYAQSGNLQMFITYFSPNIVREDVKKTALLIATENDHVNIIEFFVSYAGLKESIVDEIFNLARQKQCEKILQYFEHEGIRVIDSAPIVQ